eukprot:scaffold15630_cov156-Cylindrotheca_fusiformis.AAC.2
MASEAPDEAPAFTFPDFVGDTPLDPPPEDPTTPAGASHSSYLTAQSGGGLKDAVEVEAGGGRFCCGFIGNGNEKLCLRLKEDCSISKHKTHYCVFETDQILVRDTPNRGLVEPSVPRKKLTNDSTKYLLSLSKTLGDWESIFQGIESLAEDKSPVDLVSLNRLMRVSKPSSSQGDLGEIDPVLRRTVSISAGGMDRSGTAQESTPSYEGAGTSVFSFEDIDTFQPSESTDVDERLKAVEEHLSTTGKDLTKEMAEVGNLVAMNKTVLDEVVSMLGTTLEARSIRDINKKSVWSLLGDLTTSVESLGRDHRLTEDAVGRLARGQEDTAQTLERDIRPSITSLGKIQQNAWDKFGDIFRNLRKQDNEVIAALQERISALESRKRETVSQRYTFPSFGSEVEDASLPFSRGFASIPPLGTTPRPATNVPTSRASQGYDHQDPEVLVSKVEGLESAVIDLRSKMRDFESGEFDKGTGAVRFGSLGFRNEHDAAAFVEENKSRGSLHVGFLFDIYLLSNLVFRMANGDPNFLKTTETINKLDLKSNRAAQALLAFSSPVPELFVDSANRENIWTITAKDKSYFNRVKTFGEWKKLRSTIKDDCNIVEGSTRRQLRSMYPEVTPIRLLYENSIIESVACLNALVDYMDDVVVDLTHVGMSEARAFAMATRLGDAFFRERHKVRAAVADDLEAKNHIKLATTLWFAVTKTIDVMMDFKRRHFREHPAISSEYVQFLVQATIRDESNEDSDDKVKDVEKIAKDAKKTADATKTKMDAIQSKLAGAAKDAKDAAKAVDSLKSKLSDKGVL